MRTFLKRAFARVRRHVVYTRDYRKRVEFCRPGFGPDIGLYKFANDDDRTSRYSLKLFFVWLALWKVSSLPRDPDGILDAWSISFRMFTERNIYVHFGAWHKFIHLPWSLDWVERAHMTNAGTFVRREWRDKTGRHAEGDVPDRWLPQVFKFRYRLANGEVQETTATVQRVERMRWQWAICRRLGLPFGFKTRFSLDVWFADEMGSERGSWKGGVVGTGCAWIPGEPVEVALRRFENRCNMTHQFCR